MEKKNLAKKMLLVTALASGISLAQSYFSEAQSSTSGNYCFYSCTGSDGKTYGGCYSASNGDCTTSSTCPGS